VTTAQPETERDRGDSSNEHPIAHYRRDRELEALCGKRLKGVPAPPDTEVCIVCKELVSVPSKDLPGSF